MNTATLELEFVPGSFFPQGRIASDKLVELVQVAMQLDTITGEIPQPEVSANDFAEYLGEVSAWHSSRQTPNVIELLRRAQEPQPRDRVSGKASFDALQEWEGYVTCVGKAEFEARLADVTADERIETEQAVFSMDDVSIDDRALVQPGAVFRWSIGYERSVSGTRRKVSSIVFRRLPIWTAAEIASARSKAAELLRSIEWE